MVSKLPTINSKIELIETKHDAELILEEINSFNFSPIKSQVVEQLINTIKIKLQKAPYSKISEIEHYAKEIRLSLEELVSRTRKQQFSNALKEFVKKYELSNAEEKQISSIYAESNKYHHHESLKDISFDAIEEKNIKESIKNLNSIIKKTGKETNKTKEMYK